MKVNLLLFLLILLSFSASRGQTTAFTYQGRLTDSTATQPTNGNYDFQFSLFDLGNNQIGTTLTRSNIAVTNGVFTAQLDFGINPFADGADRFLQIATKRSIDSSYVILSPRQQLTSVPYALQTLNASTLGGIAANQFVQTDDGRMTDARNPLPSSPDYIQNGMTTQTASFNVSGNGTVGGNLSANSVNSTTNFKIGNVPMFSRLVQTSVVIGEQANHVQPTPNSTFVGFRAGFSVNGFGFSNTFIGSQAGQGTTSGWNNTFVGKDAGFFNTNGTNNSYFGASAGVGSGGGTGSSNAAFGFEAGLTIAGNRNSFFGHQSGRQNQAANDNAFFGYQAGYSATGNKNSFFGSGAGMATTTGTDNVFAGAGAGAANTTGLYNVFIGSGAGDSTTTGFGNTYLGANASNASVVGFNNTVVGRDAGGFGPNYSTNTAVGYQAGGSSNSADNTFLGAFTNVVPGVSHSTVIGAGASVDTSNTIMLGTVNDTVRAPNQLNAASIYGGSIDAGGINVNGTITAYKLKLTVGTGPGSGTNLCINASDVVVTCSSSLRYKTNIADFTRGLDVVRQLRPITFSWKTDGSNDIGFGAEEVEKVDARLVNYNGRGQVESVKYDRIATALVNAVKEQQTLLGTLQEQIKKQQEAIDGLRAVVCLSKSEVAVCKDK